MRFLIVLVGMFVCLGARAATMCMPDLSNCTSCTNFSYSGTVWSANCCGVDVSGIMISNHIDYNLGDLQYVSQSFDELGTFGSFGIFRHTCFILWPFVLPYGYVVKCDSAYVDSIVSCGAIIPKCMVEKCSDKVVCDNPYA